MESVHNQGLVLGKHIKDSVLDVRSCCIHLSLLLLHILDLVFTGWGWLEVWWQTFLYLFPLLVIGGGDDNDGDSDDDDGGNDGGDDDDDDDDGGDGGDDDDDADDADDDDV